MYLQIEQSNKITKSAEIAPKYLRFPDQNVEFAIYAILIFRFSERVVFQLLMKFYHARSCCTKMFCKFVMSIEKLKRSDAMEQTSIYETLKWLEMFLNIQLSRSN